MLSHEDCEEFFDKVLKIDGKINYVALYDGQYHAKFRDGIQRYNKDEDIKSSLSEAQSRWALDKQNTMNIGIPNFSMTQYAKENRITMGLCNGGVILISTEIGINVDNFVISVKEVCRYINETLLSGFYTR